MPYPKSQPVWVRQLVNFDKLPVNVEDTFSKCQYVSGKYTCLIIRHEIRVAIKNFSCNSTAFSKWGETFSSLTETIEICERFGGGASINIYISIQSIQYIYDCGVGLYGQPVCRAIKERSREANGIINHSSHEFRISFDVLHYMMTTTHQ